MPSPEESASAACTAKQARHSCKEAPVCKVSSGQGWLKQRQAYDTLVTKEHLDIGRGTSVYLDLSSATMDGGRPTPGALQGALIGGPEVWYVADVEGRVPGLEPALDGGGRTR